MATVELTHVCKRFGTHQVISDVTLSLEQGEFVVFVGPSGCGKSTLLRMIAGLEEITSGHLRIGGADMTERLPADRGVAMVFQSYALYPHMSVYQNMAFGLEQARLKKTAIRDRVLGAARMLQIEELLERKPRALSGGQRQRVAIGRAITRDPRVFLFDEPLSNLDAALRGETRVEIARLHARLADTTMIYVTHDQVEAMTLADRIVVLNGGHVEQVGAPLELYDRPASKFVAGFIGSPRMNFLTGDIAARHGAETCGIRPEDLAIADTGDWPGRVLLTEALGADTYVHVETDLSSEPLIARAPGRSGFRAGQSVGLTPDPERFHLFDADGRPVTTRQKAKA
ncbi:Maltose/maltodextrin import ATP-binding protein MalK [Marinibacterium anthonyi]|nr:Maltose/maltodextrin import ATP-binding protein MalK [Marinibacterium anthonyi]